MYNKAKDKILCIQGLKGFGACMIAFVWHYHHFAPQEGLPLYRFLAPFYNYGDRLVEIFFLLSGFCITYGYEGRIREGRIGFTKFIGNSVKKLFPPMWIALFVTLLLQCIILYKTGTTFVYPNLDVYHFLLNLLGLQNGILELGWSYNGPTWYISVLLCCYGVYFVCVDRCKEKEHLIFRYIALALLGVILILLEQNLPVINSLIGRGVSCFFLGSLLAKLYENRHRVFTLRIGIISVFFLVIVWGLTKHFGISVLGDFQLAVILGIAPAVVLSILFVPVLSKLFSSLVFTYLGKHSLSIYLWHFPIQCLWKVVEALCEIEFNYSESIIWGLYIISVLVPVCIYDKLVGEKSSAIFRLIIREENTDKKG